MPAERKPCPFCGGPVGVLYGSGVDLMTQDNRPGVGCPTCHFIIHGKTIHEALVVWNRRAGLLEITPSASTNNARDAIFLDHIEAMVDSPSSDSVTKIRCIRDMVERWRSGKQHPVA